jgi:FkbH-like protein
MGGMTDAAKADPRALLETYLAAAPGVKPAILGRLLVELRGLLAERRWTEAAPILRGAIEPGTDFSALRSLHRLYAELKTRVEPRQKIRLALLGGGTTSPLAQAVELALFSMGGEAEVYESSNGVYRQEILDPDSELYRFRPDVIFLAVGWRDLLRRPPLGARREEVAASVDAELADWSALWRAAHENSGGLVVQNSFDRPAWRQLDNHELRHPSSLGRFVSRLNEALADGAPAYVVLHDADSLAAHAGRRSWSDDRYFFHGKFPCAPDHLVEYGFSAASILAARMGLSRKCLVLDLDNTCWGGVAGDDGVGGLRLGPGDAEGEAFAAFQQYVKGLKQRGVLLAVCSKNDERVAKEVFEKHPGMVLRLEDIACFTANWEDKADNLREIARRLRIGLDSLVFVDDSPVERAMARRLVPEVAVPELPEDPAGFIQALEAHRHFQVLSVSSEDLGRAESYRADGAREAALKASSGVDDFLRSLAMTARIGPVTEASLQRAASLIARSNQFNLTTRRRSAAELAAVAADPRWLTRTMSLNDRFGDSGLISVLLARIDEDLLEIDTWLMSCRVLKRGAETLLHNAVCRWAVARGLKRVRGEYVATPRNGLVREHFARLGYSKVSEDADGRERWEMELSAAWKPRPVLIEEEEFHG